MRSNETRSKLKLSAQCICAICEHRQNIELSETFNEIKFVKAFTSNGKFLSPIFDRSNFDNF